MEGVGDAVSGGIAMTTTIASADLQPDAQHLGTGMECGPVTVPSRGSARMGPNGGQMQDSP